MANGGGPCIAIFSLSTDIHALAIAHELKKRHCQCYLVGTDSLIEAGGLSWSLDPSQGSQLRDLTDEWFSVSDLDLIWWRRTNSPQQRPAGISDEEYEFASRQWLGALNGILFNQFVGVWLSEPGKTTHAENKLVQLQAASKAGLRVPATLVSQEPDVVRDFIGRQDGSVVAKSVRGIRRCIQPVRVMAEQLTPQLVKFAPTMYQEFIPGDRHLRINCFGEAIYPMMYRSKSLDSRDSLPPHELVKLSPDIEAALKETMRLLDIRMAIMDAKLSPDDEFVWLEANPQGQFLYQDGLSDFDLKSRFVDFLIEEAQIGRASCDSNNAVSQIDRVERVRDVD